MGRHGAVANSLPPAAVQSPPAMPPMPHMPPKKRYLMKNHPHSVGLMQLAEVSSLQRHQPPGGDLTNHQHQRTGYGAPFVNVNGTRHREYDSSEPLNLTTASNHEVQLSRIVDKVVEKMLKTGEIDVARQGDPLRLWFSDQFETKQRNECSSSSSSPSPRQKSASPQLPSPAAAGSPGRPSAGVVPPGSDPAPDSDPGPEPGPGPGPEPDGGVVEFTIGMSDTINRVIDNVYRRDRRCEVTSCSSDCVGSTTPPEPPPPLPPPPPPPPPPAKRRSPPAAAGGRERTRAKRASPVTALPVGTPAKRSRGAATVVVATAVAAADSPLASERLTAGSPSDEDESGGRGLVIDESPTVGPGVGHSPDSRSERSPPAIEPGSPRRRGKKRNAPTDIRIGDSKLADSAASPNRGSRKRKVGKEDIIRIQKDGECGLDSSVPPSPGKDKSKSQPK